MLFRSPGLAALVTALALSACIGHIGDEPDSTAGIESDGTGPGPTLLRRLSNREYQNAVQQLLGVDASAVVATFVADDATSTFDNAALFQTISSIHAERYMAAARELATAALGSPEAFIGCDPAGASCMTDFIARFGRRAFRRPLDDDEKSRFLALAQTGADPLDGVARVVEAALQSPKFLFRVEIGSAEPSHPGARKLTGYEIATRLSFFLWSTAPDDALLDMAAAGELDSAEGVARATREMLSDSRLDQAMRSFVHQWWSTDEVLDATRDPAQFPSFSPELAQAMVDELEMLFRDHMWGEGASFMDVFSAPYGYLNDDLAGVYGVAPPGSSELARHEWGDDPDRGGIFGTAAFLTATTRGNVTSPIQRGTTLRHVAFCTELPSPPPGVMPPTPEPGQTLADAEEAHTKDPACAGCHAYINPLGDGLERYDAIGALRDSYENGEPVKQQGLVKGLDGEPTFGGAAELGRLARDARDGQRCVALHLFRFAMGRGEDGPADREMVDWMQTTFAEESFAFPELLVAFTASDAFRYRVPQQGEAP
jgi:hypothetical protein